MANSLHVAVCIATFRRPEGLRKLLESLNVLTFEQAAPPKITVVVVDNDANSTTSAADLRSAHQLIYRVEPVRGLASVRNACLDAAPDDADFVAFIDDDEWAEPDWLDVLLAMQAETGSDIVQGVVRPVYPVSPPRWMAAGRYHEVGPFIDGDSLTHGASGNVLIRRHAIAAAHARFHAEFNATGGEDVDFFHQLLRAGCRITAANHAVAYEDVPRDRMTLAWIIKRRFRTGHTLGAVAKRQGGALRRLGKATARLGLGGVEAFSGIFGSATRTVRGVTNVAWGLGTWAAFATGRTLNDRQPE